MKKLMEILVLTILCFLAAAGTASAAEIVDSGYCGGEGDGTNLTWTLDDEGLLLISGEGDMSYSYDGQPWQRYTNSINKVIIQSGVTSIDGDAFRYCTELESVKIPVGITYIGGDTFYGCSSLKNINIPDGVRDIGSDAFYGCSSLRNITIPNSVTRIQYRAFEGCSGLTSIVIPDMITCIESGVFRGCSSLTSVVIPDSVTNIEYDAFYGCSSLENIVIPDGITSIEMDVFSGCSSLTSVVIPDSVTSIKFGAFSGCSSLENITIPEGITSIGGYAFASCSSLESIIIPDGVTCIESGVFRGCSSLTSVAIPERVTSIGSEAFWECSSLTSIIIPGSVTSIGSEAFCYCSSLTSIIIPGSVTSIGSEAFWGCHALLSVGILDGVKNIEEGAFRGCRSLTNIIIPSSVTSIGADAFGGCVNLLSITIPDGVTSIRAETFDGCTNLLSITIPDGVTSIGAEAFENCSNLISIIIPDSVTSIGSSAFYNCSSLTSIQLSENIIDIGEYVFAYCSNLENVNMPPDLSNINNGTFCGCSSLTSIALPKSIKSIGEYAFDDCRSLTDITLPESIESIGEYAFYDCRSLTDIALPEGISSIRERVFYSCRSLKSISIPISVTSIEDCSFDYCNKLTDVYYGGGKNEWKAIRVGSNNYDLTSATIHYNYKTPATPASQIAYSTSTRSSAPPDGTVRVTFNGGINSVQSIADPKIDIAWNFDLFDGIASNPNYELATAALVLSANAEDDSPDRVTKTLESLGFSKILAENYDTYDDDTDRVGYVLASKLHKNQNIIAIICRGSTVGEDWQSNILNQAAGFRRASDNVIYGSDTNLGLNRYFEKYGINTDLPTKFFITGHSRGGAVANLLGAMKSAYVNTSQENIFTYTFACPNTTTDANRGNYTNIINVVNTVDPVPKVPLMASFTLSYSLLGLNNKFGTYYSFAPSIGVNDDYAAAFRSLTGVSCDCLINPYVSCEGYPYIVRYHAPATYMAELLSHQGYMVSESGRRNKIKVIPVHCPVDVGIYDSYDRFLGGITNNVPDESLAANGIFVLVNGDEKDIYVANGMDIRLEFTGTDSGTMLYAVQEADADTGEIVTEKTFENVEITSGKSMTSEVADDIAIPDTQLFVQENGEISLEIDQDGSETQVIMISFDTGSGESIRDIAVAKGSAAGALPEAKLTGYIFDGWYTDEDLTTEFDSESALDKSLTLYASYSPASEVYSYFSSISYDGSSLNAKLKCLYNTSDSKVLAALYQGGQLVGIRLAELEAGKMSFDVSMPAANLYGTYRLKLFTLSDDGSFAPKSEICDVAFIAN